MAFDPSARISTLLSRLTPTRAGYLDELGPTNMPADLDTLLGRLTSDRAGYLDELGPTNMPADLDLVKADTPYIHDQAISSPTAYSLADLLYISATEKIRDFIAKTGGSVLPASKSLYDVIALDRLDNGTYGLSALNDDLDTLLTRLSTTRAAYLDNLIGNETAGTYNHPDGVTEQDAVEITPAELIQYYKLCLDFENLAQTTYVRTYIKVDGSTYRLFDYAEFPGDYPTNTKGIIVNLAPSSKAMKVTLQSAVGEGSVKAVPYFYIRRSAA